MQMFSKTTYADRVTIGIRVRLPTRVAGTTPTLRPLVIVESGARLSHELRLVDESTPTRRARPRGVQRAEVFVSYVRASAPPPVDPETFRYVGSVTSGSTVVSFGQDEGGLSAYYVARWVATTGGPWCETAAVAVVASDHGPFSPWVLAQRAM